MTISSHIEEILLPRYTELGYKYQKESNIWHFSRNVDGVKENIEIDKSSWIKNALRLTFYSHGKSINSHRLIGEVTVEEWHYYEDEKTLRELLNFFLRITESHAMKWFENNKPVESIPAKNYLNDKEIKNALAFIERHELNFNGPDSLGKLQEILSKQPSEEDIFSSSYYFGELIKTIFGAEWENDHKGPYINHIGGVKDFLRYPLDIINLAVKHPNKGYLLKGFIAIKSTVEFSNKNN
jgi:hypothetical protein